MTEEMTYEQLLTGIVHLAVQPPDARVEAALERVLLDARRYRWLRRSGKKEFEGIEFRDGDGAWRGDCPAVEELDAVIDAALLKVAEDEGL